MIDGEQQSQPTANQSALSDEGSSTAKQAGDAPAMQGDVADGSSRKLRLALEALLLGAIFARDFFAKTPPRRSSPLKLPQRDAVDVPLESLTRSVTPAMSESPSESSSVETTSRASDRDLDVSTEAKKKVREQQGTFLVISAFLLSFAGAVAFLISYWRGLSNQMLGSSLAVSLGGFGFALVLYSHWLISAKEAMEPREKLASSPQDRDALLKDYCAAAHDVRRRNLLMWMGAAGMGLFAAMILSMMRSFGMSPYPELYNTVWKRGQRLMTSDGQPVTLTTLEQGSTVTVFPEDKIGQENAQTVLIRVKQELLDLPSDRAQWAPSGYLAYSRVCTHAGCPVALFESGTNILLCPCHQSTFDVLRAARPTGGPAARPLPQLPLYVESDGSLRAGGGFSSPPGPGFWGMS